MFLQVETNTNCNFSCWFCPNSRFPKKQARHMKMELFKLIVDNYLDYAPKDTAPLVSFADYNEPTLDPLFKERLLYLTSKDVYYWYISNCSNSDVRMLNFLRDNKIKLSNVQLNIPSGDPEKLASLVGTSLREAEKTLDNLKRIIEFKPYINANVSIAIHSYTPEDIQEFHQLVGNEAEVVHAGVFNRAGYLDDVPGIKHNTYHLSCSIGNPENIYVDVDGKMFLCCNDYNKETVYGNATDIKRSVESFEREEQLVELQKKLCINCVYANPV